MQNEVFRYSLNKKKNFMIFIFGHNSYLQHISCPNYHVFHSILKLDHSYLSLLSENDFKFQSKHDF